MFKLNETIKDKIIVWLNDKVMSGVGLYYYWIITPKHMGTLLLYIGSMGRWVRKECRMEWNKPV